MSRVEMRCRQCEWTGALEGERVPRYGARVRCPRCDAPQLVLPAAPAPMDAADPAELRDPAAVGSSETYPRPAGETGALGQAGAPPSPPVAGDLPGPAPAQTAEARKILRLWLGDLRRQTGGALDVARVFGEHGEELAHLYALWSATYPGEGSRALFRRELLGALAELAGAAPPPPAR